VVCHWLQVLLIDSWQMWVPIRTTCARPWSSPDWRPCWPYQIDLFWPC
jgi:hypothetical protein